MLRLKIMSILGHLVNPVKNHPLLNANPQP